MVGNKLKQKREERKQELISLLTRPLEKEESEIYFTGLLLAAGPKRSCIEPLDERQLKLLLLRMNKRQFKDEEEYRGLEAFLIAQIQDTPIMEAGHARTKGFKIKKG